MAYNREIQQVHDSIVKAGDGSKAEIISQGTTDPITGVPIGSGTSTTVYCVAVNYTKEDISDPSLAHGLIKLLISPIGIDGTTIENFTDLIEDKARWCYTYSG